MFDRKDALKIWEMGMGSKEYAYDFSGRKIKKGDYLETNQVGWVIGYVKPIEIGGPTHIGNIIIMHHLTAEEKGLNYPKFKIVDSEYMAYYDEKKDAYYIEKIYDDEDDDAIFL